MGKRKTNGIPDSLAKAQRRFERWRKGRRSRGRLPEELWTLATELAMEHGVNRTAKTLRLDYYSLKKRVDTKAEEAEAPPEFVEILQGIPQAASPGCTMEIDDGDGAALRIRIQGADLPDLAAIARAFRGGEP